MRDKKRIPRILNELEQIWSEYPDLRLGQLIMIATRPKNPCPEVFYIEDEDMLTGIQSIGKKTNLEDNKRTPSWEIYPDIIKIKTKEITPELVKQFTEAVRKANPDQILSPRIMLKLIGAPIEDSSWLNKQKERLKKLDFILKEFEKNGELEKVETGYKVIRKKGLS